MADRAAEEDFKEREHDDDLQDVHGQPPRIFRIASPATTTAASSASVTSERDANQQRF